MEKVICKMFVVRFPITGNEQKASSNVTTELRIELLHDTFIRCVEYYPLRRIRTFFANTLRTKLVAVVTGIDFQFAVLFTERCPIENSLRATQLV